ncbi:MAG TPA: hypothetical protein PLM53_20420 [Spirochaetota bacterium]|nr:hypothetical protein [Spirochaetota bacterium]HQF09721.1 hypothetical protein [Spirochaetota bacterium]HQH99461.1 hypothetical protein [Spirochaetota bacterium]
METRTRILGMPLFSIGLYARGFIAIGWVGRGVFTIAQFGYGAIAVTQFGFGFISLSQFGFGLVSVAQFGLGLVLGIGQGTVGFIANGLGAAGYYAMKGPGVWDRFPRLLAMVMADPAPLCVWTAAWTAVFIFLWSQRDKITIGMSPRDLFRSRRRNRIDRIRARAVSEISDQNELFETVMNDPSDMVTMAALKNITDPGLLARIAKSTVSEEVAGYVTGTIDGRETLFEVARSAALPAARIGAVARLARLDPACLVDLACREGDSLVIQQIINGVKDRASLEKIVRDAASSHAKIAAINSLEKPDQNFLHDIVRNEKDIAVREAAVLRTTDTGILSGIVLGGVDPSMKKAAIGRITDKKVLSELAAGDLPEAVRKAIENRLKDLRPQYYSLKIEFSCPFCSQPVFVNGPIKKTKCQSCLRESELSRGLWEAIAGAGPGRTEFSSPAALTADKHVIRGPLCNSCGAPLDTDDIATGARTMPPCPSCRAPQSTFPVPEWLPWSENAEQVFCAEEEGTRSPEEKDIKPVAISCIKCGAPLDITAETPRNATCTYCNTTQYLPDPLWLSLHPVKIKQAWYIRCNFRERQK